MNIKERENEKATAEDQNLPVMAAWCDDIQDFAVQGGHRDRYIYLSIPKQARPLDAEDPGDSPLGSPTARRAGGLRRCSRLTLRDAQWRLVRSFMSAVVTLVVGWECRVAVVT
ncbi:hypothetical protein BR93DRAFT_62166 [Coniochaeta sp. PMI_546]|nr:hypothetical protein BR93DRAFT_62166 [Coniochaeta sp. PMI_546]